MLCCILTIIDWSILIKEQRALYFVIEEEHQITLAANAYNKYNKVAFVGVLTTLY